MGSQQPAHTSHTAQPVPPGVLYGWCGQLLTAWSKQHTVHRARQLWEERYVACQILTDKEKQIFRHQNLRLVLTKMIKSQIQHKIDCCRLREISDPDDIWEKKKTTRIDKQFNFDQQYCRNRKIFQAGVRVLTPQHRLNFELSVSRLAKI